MDLNQSTIFLFCFLSPHSPNKNNEFEWYTSDDENSFAKNGKLYIRPTLTADKIGADEVEHGHVHLDDCTYDDAENCDKQAGGDTIINPIRSARLNTLNSFTFKFGRVEFVAKLPIGDWMWPGILRKYIFKSEKRIDFGSFNVFSSALWLLAAEDKYEGWTGEIDVMESRGNRKYVKQIESTLHYGQLFNDNHKSDSFEKTNARGFDQDFHTYGLVWDDKGIEFFY